MIDREIDSNLLTASNLVLNYLLNSDAANANSKWQHFVADWTNSLLTESLRLKTFTVGSLSSGFSLPLPPLNLFPSTPSSSIGHSSLSNVYLSFCLGPSNSYPWILKACESLYLHSLIKDEEKKITASGEVLDQPKKDNSSLKNISVESISYYPLETRLEAIINNISVNIIPNDFSSLGTTVILEEFNKLIPQNNFFMRCLHLIKAWCSFEAPAFVSKDMQKGMSTSFA